MKRRGKIENSLLDHRVNSILAKKTRIPAGPHNGGKLRYTARDAIQAVEGLADGSISEPLFAQWLRAHSA